jgi:hypothetical protein
MDRLDRIAEQQAIGEGSTALLEITYLEDELTHIQSLYETNLDAITRCWFPTATQLCLQPEEAVTNQGASAFD